MWFWAITWFESKAVSILSNVGIDDEGQEEVAIVWGSFKNTTITEMLSDDPWVFESFTSFCVTSSKLSANQEKR